MSYSQLVVSDSPLGYWKLDSWNSLNPNFISSSTATYASQYNASYSGIKPIVAGISNSTKLGSTSSVVIPNNYSIFTQGNERIPATLELWFNIVNTSSQKYSIIRPMNSSTGSSIFECYVKNDKLWIESGANKQYIGILNWENQQYLNVSYLNGNITMSLNNTDTISMPTSSFSYDCNQFVIGPGNSDGPLFVNSLAIYKYVMNKGQMERRLNWGTRTGNTQLLMIQDGLSLAQSGKMPETSYNVELLNDSFYNNSSNKNINYKDGRLFLKKLDEISVSASNSNSTTNYTLNSNGIKFDISDRTSYLDITPYIDFFSQSNSTIRMQLNASSTASGNVILFSGFKNYKYMVGKVILSNGPKFKLSLIDQYDNEAQSITTSSMSNGYHGIAINFNTASISLSLDNASVSNTILTSTLGGPINSIILGGYPNTLTSVQNSISSNDFTYGTNGWSASGTAAVVIENASYSYDGYYSIKATASNSGNGGAYYFNNGSTASPTSYMIPVTASNSYQAYGYVYSNNSASCDVRIDYYNSNLVKLSTTNVGTKIVSSSTGWTYAEVIGTAPASAAYAVPYFSASNFSSTASVYWSGVGFNMSQSASFAYGYSDYIKNFAIDPYTASIADFTSRGYFMLKLNNDLKISQKGVISSVIPDKTTAGGVLDTYATYSNPSALSTVEYGKQGSSSITWTTIPSNYPLPGYDYASTTFDQMRITLATDDAYNDVPVMDYFDLRYTTASSYYTIDAAYQISSDVFSTASLSDAILTDVAIDQFSKPTNTGIRLVPNITGGIKITPNSSASINGIKRIDTLFKINNLPSAGNTALVFSQQGSNILSVDSSGTLAATGTASVYVDNSYSLPRVSAGDIYYLSVLFSSSVSYAHLGSSSVGLNMIDGSFGMIAVSPNSTASYSSHPAYISKIWNNLFDYESSIYGNNLLPTQLASAESYDQTSASWGFLGSSCTLTRSSASSAHGTYSIQAVSSFSSASIRIATTASSNNLVPVVPSRNYVAMAKIASSISRNASIRLIWYSQQSTTSSISVSSATLYPTSTAWTNYIFTASAPINAQYAGVEVKIDSASSTDIHYIDEFGVFAENVSTWTVPQLNNLDINDGSNQTTSDTAKNYFSSDGSYFEMYALPKVKIITKRSANTII